MNTFFSVLLLAHLVATMFMTGVIWFVQIVHYPLFILISPAQFTTYEAAHIKKTGYVVAPVMLLEMTTYLSLCFFPFETFNQTLLFYLSGLFLLLLWCLTFFVQAKQHARLIQAYNRKIILALVRLNWWRCLLWTGRSILIGLLAVESTINAAT